MILSVEHLNRLRLALRERPYVRRAAYVEGGEKPLLAFEYDGRPASAEEARRPVGELVDAVAALLGRARFDLGFSAGGPEEIGPMAETGAVVYERTDA